MTATAAAQPDTAGDLFGHPKGLYICFATEMWERFSFYGMKYLLLLYLTKYHLFTDDMGLEVLGSYTGLVYALPVIGGVLADRYLGMRKAVLFGGLLLVLGHLLMAVEGHQAVQYEAGTVLEQAVTLANGEVIAAGTLLQETIKIQDLAALKVFYLALALIVVGVGFLKPNISTIVGQLYPEGDERRDSGFTIFYMGINIGSFIATVVCGWLGETYGWGYGFGLAGIGMLLGLVTFIWGQKYLNGLAEPNDPEVMKQKAIGPLTKEWAIYLGSFASLALFWFVVQHEPIVFIGQQALLVMAGVGLLAYTVQKGTKEDIHRMLVLLVLIASTIVFWSLFEQSAGSMTLYADRVVDRSFGGFEFTASQFGSLNAFFIMLLALPFAWIWVQLSKRGMNPNAAVKFGLGIVLAGLGFGALVLGAQSTDDLGRISMWWLVLAYLLHTMGELCLSPVGLSAVTKLSLHRIVGMAMGTWFLATALAETVAQRIAKMASIDTSTTDLSDVTSIVGTYTELYTFLMWLGVGVGIFMIVISPILKKGMHGVN
ncbi:peptide MFS transporter [Pseudoteredinibacter isoporae]|uniref:POT family proton-dependent oligopeptide transporter n=1 Tax=Pseudoteredinibacter isoporae TaxID=570281 RepID=A0A7X0JS77_9GAMM|nr:peptide MFS transporter [Pseudoteredinibacter isoporae]MBB6521323.1 POT family proton-dependent oligopeptide transporter [Pseudoteredinibacter isoporae]NHO86878.1 peptide MFS transporter [Pseudoteredinibacter isoporae]NIB24670.1 peptide MFS transporter [Pseudoteredinibacter isoporae]